MKGRDITKFNWLDGSESENEEVWEMCKNVRDIDSRNPICYIFGAYEQACASQDFERKSAYEYVIEKTIECYLK